MMSGHDLQVGASILWKASLTTREGGSTKSEHRRRKKLEGDWRTASKAVHVCCRVFLHLEQFVGSDFLEVLDARLEISA